MVLVVDHTLVMVSRSHSAPVDWSASPPQMSTTGSPWRYTATEAPTSAPVSRLSERTERTPSNFGPTVPCTSAMTTGPLGSLVVGARTLWGMRAPAPAGAR